MYEEEPETLTREKAQEALDVLQSAFGTLMSRIADYIVDHDDDIREGGFALTEVLDRYGMQLMSFGSLFSNLSSFAEPEGSGVPSEEPSDDTQDR